MNKGTKTRKTTKQEQNVRNCAKVAAEHAREIQERIRKLTEIAQKLNAEAQDNLAKGKAHWGIAGSLGFIVDQLDETLEGFQS